MSQQLWSFADPGLALADSLGIIIIIIIIITIIIIDVLFFLVYLNIKLLLNWIITLKSIQISFKTPISS